MLLALGIYSVNAAPLMHRRYASSGVEGRLVTKLDRPSSKDVNYRRRMAVTTADLDALSFMEHQEQTAIRCRV